MGEQEMQEVVECSTTDFPPRPNLTEPDWWHVWKPLQDDIDQQQQDQPGATAVIPRCLIEFVEDITCAAIGQREPVLKSVRKEDQGRYATACHRSITSNRGSCIKTLSGRLALQNPLAARLAVISF